MVWVIVAVLVIARQRRSQRLQEGFGSETLAEKGDRRAAESELLQRRERRQQLVLRELESRVARTLRRALASSATHVRGSAERRRRGSRSPRCGGHARPWLSRRRGLRAPRGRHLSRPRAADISVDHPVVVENYRAAHGISVRAARNEAETEDLRQALVHFRSLFEELLGADDKSRDTDEAKEMHR